MCGDNVVSMSSKSRAPRKYAVRAVVFQEGEWLRAQCLGYDRMVQAKNLQQLSRALRWSNVSVSSRAFPAKTSACRSVACLGPLLPRHLREPAQRVDQSHLLDRARA